MQHATHQKHGNQTSLNSNGPSSNSSGFQSSSMSQQNSPINNTALISPTGGMTNIQQNANNAMLPSMQMGFEFSPPTMELSSLCGSPGKIAFSRLSISLHGQEPPTTFRCRFFESLYRTNASCILAKFKSIVNAIKLIATSKHAIILSISNTTQPTFWRSHATALSANIRQLSDAVARIAVVQCLAPFDFRLVGRRSISCK